MGVEGRAGCCLCHGFSWVGSGAQANFPQQNPTTPPTQPTNQNQNQTKPNQIAAPDSLPYGMGVQIIDCAGARLSMVNSDTIAAFRVFASFGVYYPERLGRAVVVNAPGWFDMPW